MRLAVGTSMGGGLHSIRLHERAVIQQQSLLAHRQLDLAAVLWSPQRCEATGEALLG